MAMGTRKRRQRQEQLWVTHTELAMAPGHPFYKRLSQVLDGEKFDEFCERECALFYADHNGRPSLTPGTYFRLLLVGYRGTMARVCCAGEASWSSGASRIATIPGL